MTQSIESTALWPIVEWKLFDGTALPPTPLLPESFGVHLDEQVVATRKQLPCILAWAMSIHKSQGQTLDRLKIDVGSVFEKGQVYVAASRCRSADSLQILNFDSKKVRLCRLLCSRDFAHN